MTAGTDATKNKGAKPTDSQPDSVILRTKLALERTLDAWIRTALSMISFGFTIYKFLQGVQPEMAARPNAPRNVGLALVTMGTLALVAAIYQHIMSYRELGLHVMKRPVSIAVLLATFIVILGVLIFLDIAIKVGPF